MPNSYGDLVSVIAGLSVGIMLIVVFSIMFASSSGDEIIRKVRNLPEVQAFQGRYSPMETSWTDGITNYIAYTASGQLFDPSDSHAELATKELRLIVETDADGRTSMTLWCLGRTSDSLEPTIEVIRTTECIEKP